MPLDTTPLSPLRRTLAVVVNLLILAGSLALAQAVIKRHPGGSPITTTIHRLTFVPAVPPGFARIQGGPDALWVGPIAGKIRQLRTSVEPAADPPTLESAREIALDALRETGAIPGGEAPGLIAGAPAITLLGLDAAQRPIAVLSIAVVEGYYVTILLLADKPERLGDLDLTAFERICQKSQLLIDGHAFRPHQAP